MVIPQYGHIRAATGHAEPDEAGTDPVDDRGGLVMLVGIVTTWDVAGRDARWTMSAMTVMPHAVGEWTVDDLDQLPDDTLQYELLDGLLLVTPAPTMFHQRAVGNLYLLLRAACPWLVDPMAPSIEALDLVDGHYVPAGDAAADTTLGLEQPFGIEIVPAELVRPPW